MTSAPGSFRDRFFTPGVARAITSPSAILAGGAGAAIGVLWTGGPLAAVLLGLAAVAARVLASVPRAPRRPGINPRQLDEPWRGIVEENLDAARRFEVALAAVREGPLRERLGEMGTRLSTAVDESWRIAVAGNSLTNARRQIDSDRILTELSEAESATPTERSEQTIRAIRSQLASAERLDATIADTHDRLRLLDARIDETVTRTVELSVSQAGPEALGGLGVEMDAIVDDMEALRQALEETHRPGPSAAPGAS